MIAGKLKKEPQGDQEVIIASTDFSPAAQHAVQYAADLAAALRMKLILFHVHQVPVSYTEIPLTENIEEEVKKAEMELRHLRRRISLENPGELVIESRVKVGLFFNELEKIAGELEPAFVVMGCQGTTAAERIAFGSHAVHAMKHLQWPLLTVPPGAIYAGLNRLALACDMEKTEETVPDSWIRDFVKETGALLYVVNCNYNIKSADEWLVSSRHLQNSLKSIHAQYNYLSGNKDISESLLSFIGSEKIDWLITLPRHHGFFHQLTHSSQSRKLLLHSPVPVLTLHNRRQEA